MSADAEIEWAQENDGPRWRRAESTGFLAHPGPDADVATWWSARYAERRFLGAWEGARCVGTLRSIPFELTVPGGAAVRCDGVAGVTVATGSQGRGLLRKMLTTELAYARDGRQEPLAVLTAAEHAIYGRFGFGHATQHRGWDIDVSRSGGLKGGDLGGPDAGTMVTLDRKEYRSSAPALFDVFRRSQHGTLSRSPLQWDEATGCGEGAASPEKTPFVLAHLAADGTIAGVVVYAADAAFTDGDPDARIVVHDHFARTPAVALSLWRHLFDLAWARRIHIQNLAPEDPLLMLLVNPRAARPTGGGNDDLWVRLLDGPQAFAARRYESAGTVVLDVRDDLGHVNGNWKLATREDESGDFTASLSEPELVLDVSALGSLFLGGASAVQMHRAGLITERRPGAVRRLGQLLRTSVPPWCPDTF